MRVGCNRLGPESPKPGCPSGSSWGSQGSGRAKAGAGGQGRLVYTSHAGSVWASGGTWGRLAGACSLSSRTWDRVWSDQRRGHRAVGGVSLGSSRVTPGPAASARASAWSGVCCTRPAARPPGFGGCRGSRTISSRGPPALAPPRLLPTPRPQGAHWPKQFPWPSQACTGRRSAPPRPW